MHDSEKNRVLLLTFARISNVFFMWLSLVLLVAGLALLVKGGDWLVTGSSSLARKYGISELLIGLTVVALGLRRRSWWLVLWRRLTGIPRLRWATSLAVIISISL